jgi:hypothetical protein
MLDESLLLDARGGQDAAAAWHTRVMADEVVAYAFSDGFRPQHTERLAAYWAEVLGWAGAVQRADRQPFDLRADLQRQRISRGDGPSRHRLL